MIDKNANKYFLIKTNWRWVSVNITHDIELPT